jgi:hypothetical protein
MDDPNRHDGTRSDRVRSAFTPGASLLTSADGSVAFELHVSAPDRVGRAMASLLDTSERDLQTEPITRDSWASVTGVAKDGDLIWRFGDPAMTCGEAWSLTACLEDWAEPTWPATTWSFIEPCLGFELTDIMRDGLRMLRVTLHAECAPPDLRSSGGLLVDARPDQLFALSSALRAELIESGYDPYTHPLGWPPEHPLGSTEPAPPVVASIGLEHRDRDAWALAYTEGEAFEIAVHQECVRRRLGREELEPDEIDLIAEFVREQYREGGVDALLYDAALADGARFVLTSAPSTPGTSAGEHDLWHHTTLDEVEAARARGWRREGHPAAGRHRPTRASTPGHRPA